MEGYFYETGKQVDTESASFTERMEMFQDAVGNYTKTARLAGFLYHDLIGNVAGIPPGCPIKIELWRNKDKLAIDSRTSGNDATIIIESIKLHLPIGSLDMSLFNDYEKILHKHPARVRFRRWVVRVSKIHQQKKPKKVSKFI